MNEDKLRELRIHPSEKRRSARSLWIILLVVALVAGAAVYYAIPRASDAVRVIPGGQPRPSGDTNAAPGAAPLGAGARALAGSATNVPAPLPIETGDVVLTVSGYIVNHERIELSPRFMGLVQWIGVRKGDTVTNGQVLVRLDDTEFRARLAEQQGRLASARANVEKARLVFERTRTLARDRVESAQLEDDARLNLDAAQAAVEEIEGQMAQTRAYLDWCTIRSPIDGVVLEKLVDANELVTPQSFGGTRGPSTALVAVADPKDLQVEVDVNESDLAKIRMGQRCRVSPEAYLERHYDGRVVEIAPEANRQKGTLQIKVQIEAPDKFLTPELSARVEFLARRASDQTEPSLP